MATFANNRRLLADTNATNSTTTATLSLVDQIFTWQCGVLFLGFCILILAWELGTALLSYTTLRYSGRKAIWITRLKVSILLLLRPSRTHQPSSLSLRGRF